MNLFLKAYLRIERLRGKEYENDKVVFEGEYFEGKRWKGKEYKDGKLIFEVEYFLKKMGTNSL